MPDLYRVTTRTACASLILENGRVTGCAPILRKQMQGRVLAEVEAQVRRWGGTLERLGPAARKGGGDGS